MIEIVRASQVFDDCVVKIHPTAIGVYVQKSRPPKAAPPVIKVRDCSKGMIVSGFASF